MKILIVEDDLALARELCLLCRHWEFEADYTEDFEHVDIAFLDSGPDFFGVASGP